jgi:hypothetical protein
VLVLTNLSNRRTYVCSLTGLYGMVPVLTRPLFGSKSDPINRGKFGAWSANAPMTSLHCTEDGQIQRRVAIQVPHLPYLVDGPMGCRS